MKRIFYKNFYNSAKYIVFFFLLIIICNLSAAPQLKVQPDTSYVSIADTFQINITINNVQGLFAVAFDFVYDSTNLKFISIQENQFLNQGGTLATSFIYDISQAGRIIVALSLLDYTLPGVSTAQDTSIVSIKFASIDYGWAELHLENTGLIRPDLTNILHQVFDGIVDIMGAPQIINIPDTSFYQGDSLVLNLNKYVVDPDTPIPLLNWKVLKANNIIYKIDSLTNRAYFFSVNWSGNTSVVLKVEDPTGFFDTDTFIITVMPPNGIENIVRKKLNDISLKIYPNPFNFSTTLELETKEKIVYLKIFDLLGKQIESRKLLNPGNGHIRLSWPEAYIYSKISSGCYLISIITKEKIIQRKILFVK